MRQTSAFPPTRWTLVLAAGQNQSLAAQEALSELCQAYWYPLYAFVRRMGYSAEDAQDITQGFFARFLEKRYFSYADPAKGHFRSFLLTSMKNFLKDQADHLHAEKRGGMNASTLELADAEKMYGHEFAGQDTPETLFERAWALTLISRVTGEIRNAFEREGRAQQFELLKQFLPGEGGGLSYSDAAREIGTSEGALKVAVHRLRRRYRDLFHAEITHLVADAALVDGEVRHLLNVLRN